MVDEVLGRLRKLCLRLPDVPKSHVGLGELEAGQERQPRECFGLRGREAARERQLVPCLFEPATAQERSGEDADLEHGSGKALGTGSDAAGLLCKQVARDVIATLGGKYGS